MTKKNIGPCTTVGKGGVGESGASSSLHHQVTSGPPKNMVVRTTDNSLCQNTGAIAVVVINGQPAAYGNVTETGSSISAEAREGDHVNLIVHTIPLFNDIMCIRLGELEFILDECDFV